MSDFVLYSLKYESVQGRMRVPANLLDKIHRINYLSSEPEVLYHQASFKIGHLECFRAQVQPL